MIGIGTPSNQRSAPLAMIASVGVTDNGATQSGFRNPVNRAPPCHKEKRGSPERRGDPLVNYDRSKWGKGDRTVA